MKATFAHFFDALSRSCKVCSFGKKPFALWHDLVLSVSFACAFLKILRFAQHDKAALAMTNVLLSLRTHVRNLTTQFRYIIMVMLTTFFFCISAKAQVNPSSLVKKWKISCQGVINKMDAPQRAAFEQKSAEAKALFRNQIESNTFEFNADSTYVTRMASGKSFQGTWRLITPTSNTFEVHLYLGQHEIIYRIDRLISNEMVLTPKNNPTQQLLLIPIL